jgi:hypothetical protein
MPRQARGVTPLPEIASQRFGRPWRALSRAQVGEMPGRPHGVDGGAQLVRQRDESLAVVLGVPQV